MPRAHVCSTECNCGHWKVRRNYAHAGGTRGKVTLDVLDGSVDGPTYNQDYSEYETEDEDDD